MAGMFRDDLDVSSLHITKDVPVECAVDDLDSRDGMKLRIQHLRTWYGPGFRAVVIGAGGSRILCDLCLGTDVVAYKMAREAGEREFEQSLILLDQDMSLSDP